MQDQNIIPVSAKPLKAKPIFYATLFGGLQAIAKEMGYNLLIHGSINRDMDLVAVPWVDEPKPEIELIQSFHNYLCGTQFINAPGDIDNTRVLGSYLHSYLPGGRSNYVINLNRGDRRNGWIDEQYYLDISITPLVKIKQ